MQTDAARPQNSVLAAVAATAHPSDWLALLDREQRCVHLQRGELGEIPEQLIAMQDGDSRELVVDVLRRGARHEAVRVFDDPQLGPRVFEYEFRPLRDGADVAAVVVSCNEATARRATSQAGRLHAHVLEALNDGVVLLDTDCIVKMMNPAAQRLLGCEALIAIGTSIEKISKALASAIQRRSDSPLEIEVLRADAAATILQCRVSKLRIENAHYRIAVLHDITAHRQLERELIATEQRERERIARELHDGMGQELTGVALLLRSCLAQINGRDADLQAQIGEAAAIVNRAIGSIRDLSSGIFSAAIADRDLVGALTVLAERSTAHSGNDVRFRYVSSMPLALSESQAGALFRIAQEATTNALRHSEAQGVEITLGNDAAGVLLAVEDNGIGCPLDAEQRGGSGLRIMRFRAHAIGAQFKILVARVGGTRIECSLPLPVC